MTARDEILARLRRGAGGAVPELPAVRSATSDRAAAAVDFERFTAALQRLGANAERVSDAAARDRRIAALLEEHDARTVALSDATEVQVAAAALPSTIVRLPHDADRAQLLAADAGLTSAQWAVAETGTLCLVAAAEHHRLASLLPRLHIVLLPADRLLPTLGDLFQHLEPAPGTAVDPTITFVTGPSRTADIELELVVGVHGPQRLCVLVVGGEAAQPPSE